jgi:hypothetical protein
MVKRTMLPRIIWRKEAHRTLHIDAYNVTPVAQTIGIKLRAGGWLWQLPLAVEVEDERSGEQSRLPIPDPTRTLVWLLAALTLIVLLITVRSAWRGRQHARGQRVRQERIKKYV